MPFPAVPSTPTAVLGDDLIRVFKLLQSVRAHAPRQHPGVDPMAYPLLFQLASRPMRVSELADLVHTDVSTVSRQVSTLVELELVSRDQDPDDGRAQALTLTAEGRRLLGDNATYAALLTRHLLNAADFLPLQQRILKERRDAWIK